jgi:hypothetical protein
VGLGQHAPNRQGGAAAVILRVTGWEWWAATGVAWSTFGWLFWLLHTRDRFGARQRGDRNIGRMLAACLLMLALMLILGRP